MTLLRRSLLAAMIGAGLILSLPACTTPRSSSVESVKAPQKQSALSDVSIYELPSEWRDQSSAPRTLVSLAGRVQVLTMVYTSCSATCPLILADLKRIEASIPVAQRDSVGFVLVSLDPHRDTPGRLARWASETQLDGSRWTLLAGSDDDVRALAATIDVRYQRQPDGEMAHTNAIVVLDRRGVIRHQQLGLGSTDESVHAVARLFSATAPTSSTSTLE